MSFRDPTSPDVVIERDGDEQPYVLARGEGDVIQWNPSFVPETVQEQQSGAFSYDDRPKSISQPLSFERWDGGCGVENAPPGTTAPTTYSYAQGVDPSWGQLCLSPEAQAITGLSEAPTKFYASPTYGCYCLTATTVYRLQAGEWVSVYTPAAAPTDLKEYANSTATYLFLALGDSTNMVYTTSATFSGAAILDGTERATFFAVRGSTSVEPVLFATKRNGLTRSSTNPIATANWSNEDQIGSRGERVTALPVANDLLWFLKEEAIYTFDGSTIDSLVNVDLLKRSGNGAQTLSWVNGHLFTNYGNRVLQINPFDSQMERVWAPTHPELNGTITAMTADLRYLYIFVQNAAGNTYVVKHDIIGAEAPHTIAYLSAQTVNAATVVASGIGDLHASNDVLMFGTGTTAKYYILPRDGYRPWEDVNCRFEQAGGTLYGSWVDKGAAVFPAWLNGARMLTLDASGAKSVTGYYGTDGASALTSAIVGMSAGLHDETVTTEVSFTTIRYSVTLATGDNQHSPRLQALVFDCTPNPPRHRYWQIALDLGDKQSSGKGSNRPQSFEHSLAHLFDSVGKRVTYTDYFGETYTAKVLNAAVQSLTKTGVGTGRAGSSRAIVVVSIVEISETATVTLPFIWGATLTGAGGSKWSDGYQWQEAS